MTKDQHEGALERLRAEIHKLRNLREQDWLDHAKTALRLENATEALEVARETVVALAGERDDAQALSALKEQTIFMLICERDEARAQWDAAGEDSEALAAEVNRLRTQRNEARAELAWLRAGLREWYAAQVEAMGPDEATWSPHHGELAEMLPQHERADLRGGDDDRA